ncbi:hypothetical protein [Magnetococcus marinus]|uniref:hypothetical protein n=1 Tax=Magnetococcus marinus TaxID=1124597 RepID=UPI0002D70224|nr:hypothetical protein [Magnetococcus marinus]
MGEKDAKLVVKIDYRAKVKREDRVVHQVVNTVRTATMVDTQALQDDGRFDLVEGTL